MLLFSYITLLRPQVMILCGDNVPSLNTIYKEIKIIKNEKRCRNGVPKSTQTRMKVMVNIPSLHLFTKEQ